MKPSQSLKKSAFTDDEFAVLSAQRLGQLFISEADESLLPRQVAQLFSDHADHVLVTSLRPYILFNVFISFFFIRMLQNLYN